MAVVMRLFAAGTRAQLHRPARLSSSRQVALQSGPKHTRFSTSSRLSNEKKPAPAPKQTQPNASQEVEMPSFDINSLGLSKNMRILVLVLISIFGTIETWFWCKAIWRWWKGDTAEVPEEQ